jgi:hypothetical protein
MAVCVGYKQKKANSTSMEYVGSVRNATLDTIDDRLTVKRFMLMM